MTTEFKRDCNSSAGGAGRMIKCVVWDLDNTLWHGILSEGDDVVLKSDVQSIIQALDQRGILQSIASKNDFHAAMRRLEQFELREYFLYPQISWNSKAATIKTISQSLNIGMDAIAFVDDQPAERAEVSFSHPEVLCLDAALISEMLDMPEFKQSFYTEDAVKRRHLYLSDIERREAEEKFLGPQEEFLKTLGMTFTIFRAGKHDLDRAEELTVRTHQLNTTGYTYSYDELDHYRKADEHLLLMAELEDRFGSYGKIGLALVQCANACWTIKLLLMSCRVMSRGVGTVLISHIATRAKSAGANLHAEFIPNGRNRMMYITYRLAGFREADRAGELRVLENTLDFIQPFPAYLEVKIQD